jgi:hypothetical protein
MAEAKGGLSLAESGIAGTLQRGSDWTSNPAPRAERRTPVTLDAELFGTVQPPIVTRRESLALSAEFSSGTNVFRSFTRKDKEVSRYLAPGSTLPVLVVISTNSEKGGFKNSVN